MGGSGNDQDADCHFAASFFAAIINFPLWRASAIAQSGFNIEGSNVVVRYYKAVTMPPYKGMAATMLGMTWARGAIFYGSENGRKQLKKYGLHEIIATTVPPMLIGILVQVINMPLVRATITIQDPKCDLPNVRSAISHIYSTKGISGLWHGVSAGILKTVPKYITAVVIKDICEEYLPSADESKRESVLFRSAIKSISAGICGAALTNPLDVLRNEMFKTDMTLTKTFQKLIQEEGWSFMNRGLASNLTAVAVPIAATIFLTDVFKSMKRSGEATNK